MWESQCTASLPNGTVFLAGGRAYVPEPASAVADNKALLYNPIDGSYTELPDLDFNPGNDVLCGYALWEDSNLPFVVVSGAEKTVRLALTGVGNDWEVIPNVPNFGLAGHSATALQLKNTFIILPNVNCFHEVV